MESFNGEADHDSASRKVEADQESSVNSTTRHGSNNNPTTADTTSTNANNIEAVDEDLTLEEQHSDGTSESTPNGASSPGSHSHSSSTRQQRRVIEVIFDTQNPQDLFGQWMIAPDFYDEDIAENSDHDMMLIDHFNEYDYEGIDVLSGDEADDADDDDIDEVDEDDIVNDDDPEGDGIDQDAFEGPNVPRILVIPGEDFAYQDRRTPSSSGESDAQGEDYDIALPENHGYLGNNLEESQGITIFTEGSRTNLTVLHIPNVVVLPGQTVPIDGANLHHRIKSSIRHCLYSLNKTTMGLISELKSDSIGTTFEVRNFTLFRYGLKLIIEGHQRFRLIEPKSFHRASEAVVEILPEITLGRPPYFIRFPPWAIRMYDSQYIVEELYDHIKDWCSQKPKCYSDNEINKFSYWLTANLPINNQLRRHALSLKCAEARLLWLRQLLRDCDSLACANCNTTICYMKDVFPMSRSGPQNCFVNPSGFIHDTLTVRRAQGLLLTSRECTEYSWFPCYAWMVAECRNCGHHIGWRFKTNENKKPAKFYGLSRTNITLKGDDTDLSRAREASESEQSSESEHLDW